uniref:Uncharacterized protein n=1 Tax=Anguilla anguilla TaxID=7936 RepID=A0A0E9RMY5_ANGAN
MSVLRTSVGWIVPYADCMHDFV